jgi:hypothetical protein
MTDAGCDCDCCVGIHAETPREVSNPPGLPAIRRRVGTHPEFLATMDAALGRELAPGVAPLRELADRAPADLTIALLDAWATVADVITFYQERISNESYRRTATERRSLYELARLIGYRPGPGLAAAVDLAFTLDDFPQAPPVHTDLPAGLKVQSVPVASEPAQIYETIEPAAARSEWNELRPLGRQPTVLPASAPSVTVAIDAGVVPGDLVLIVDAAGTAAPHTVLAVHPDPAAAVATLDLIRSPRPVPFTMPTLPPGSAADVPGAALDDAAVTELLAHAWRAADVAALCRVKGWDEPALEQALNQATRAAENASSGRVFALRQRAAVFGHNAPEWKSLPVTLRYKTQAQVVENGQLVTECICPAYPDDWDKRTLEADASPSEQGRTVDLDGVYPGFAAGGWAVLVTPRTDGGVAALPLRVNGNVETSRTDFTLSGKISRLLVDYASPFADEYQMRTTAVFGHSDRLTIRPAAVTDDVSGNQIMLGAAFPGLPAGQAVALSGERRDLPGVTTTEVRTLADVLLVGGYTVLVLDIALSYAYRRETVRVNANVARATHGETRTEILGSGDASQPFQQFPLKQPPLTYVGSADPAGASSTLEVLVNEVRWTEVPDLTGHGPRERVYRTLTDDAGSTVVQFGDGQTGARPPTGQDNVRAVYRRGIGLAGLVPADSLTAPLSRPLGVGGVTNPLPAAGAADPESLDEIRDNLPLQVMTLDRVVSLRDHEDFSRAFAGVRKALAVDLWDGQRRAVAITVAGPDGAAIPPGGTVHDHLTAALRLAGDPYRVFTVDSYNPRFFRIDATLTYDPAYQPDFVRSAVIAALTAGFGFDARSFAQPVALSEVIGVIQGVAGVAAVDVNELFRTDIDPQAHPEPWLPAYPPAVGLAAELLTIDPAGITVR